MRLVILLGLFLLWAAASVPQTLNYPSGGVAYAAEAPSLFSVGAQAVTTSTATSTATLPPAIGPVISSPAVVTLTATIPATETATLEATATSTAPPLPTIAVPVVGTDVPLQLNPFDSNFLFGPPKPPMGPFSWASLAFMVALLAGSGYVYAVKRPQWKRTNTVLYRAAGRWGQQGLWLAIVGLLLILFRVIALDFFNLRFWLYFWLLVLVGVATWFLYWSRTTYPKEMEKFRKTQRARQYMPGGAVKTPARQPDRAALKLAPQPKPSQKPAMPAATPSSKAGGSKKRGKGK